MKRKIVFALIMGVITTGIISFTVISANLGFVEHFSRIWLKSWSIAYVIVIPSILVFGPMVDKLVSRLMGENKITKD
jgi:hypothetical protein